MRDDGFMLFCSIDLRGCFFLSIGLYSDKNNRENTFNELTVNGVRPQTACIWVRPTCHTFFLEAFEESLDGFHLKKRLHLRKLLLSSVDSQQYLTLTSGLPRYPIQIKP